MSKVPTTGRVLKEALFVQVPSPDDRLVFLDVTKDLGRTMRYDKPTATCAMRVTENAVVFSGLKYTNRDRVEASKRLLELPHNPLERAARKAASIIGELPEGQIAVELNDEVHYLNYTRDENGVVNLETPLDVEDHLFDLPYGRVRLTVCLPPARGDKWIAVAFQGHVGKPETKETLVRVTAMALNLLSGLPAFNLVTGIETVNVPASPGRYVAKRPTIRDADRARVTIPINLWNEDETVVPIGETEATIEIDLETANPISGRLLFHVNVPEDYKEIFQPYRNVVIEAALAAVTSYLGPDEVNELVFRIALGELGDGDLERLRNAIGQLAEIPGPLNISQRQWAPASA